MSMNVVTLLYLVASVCFIQALKGLSHPTTSIRGNIFGMVGMTIAVFTTAALIYEVSGGSLVFLALLGGLAARAGRAPLLPAILRVTFWSSLAMGLTAGAGALFGTTL